MKRFVLIAILFAIVMLFGRPVYASFCVSPGFEQGVSSAKAIFLGRITKVEPRRTREAPTSEYIVTFKVETWFKGAASSELRVLWRTFEDPDCEWLLVGETGEDYLVYADPSRKINPKDQLLEVTPLNRTSKVPMNQKPEEYLLSDWSKQKRVSPSPELKRRDGSEDLKVLRVLRSCDCVVPYDSNLLPSAARESQEKRISECRPCWRRSLKPF